MNLTFAVCRKSDTKSLYQFESLNIFFSRFLFSFFYTGPNAPPSNVRGHNTSSTIILVQWGDVPAAAQNGIIRSYTVTYRALPDGSPVTKIVDAPTTFATLTGLNESTNYSIKVFASTVKGDGIASTPIVVITDKDGKLIKLVSFNTLW